MNRTICLLLILFSAVIARNPALAQRETATARKTAQQSKSILQSLVGLFKSPKNRLITRSGEVCPIAPGQLGEQIIWSDRPLFIWQGNIPKSQISLYSASVNFDYRQQEQLLWQQTVPANSQIVAYTGQKLTPGLTYDWELTTDDKSYRPGFILMKQSAREAIAADLDALEKQLQANRATPEDIAIAKADYFLKQELWSDAIQQLYTVEKPSAHLLDKIEDIKKYLC